jgi:hypothetical protein
MLRQDVVEACAAGRFAIFAVRNVDQAIELLTGVPAGEADGEGLVPEGTINFQVAAELTQLSTLRQAFAAAGRPRSGNGDRSEPATDARTPSRD